MKKLGILVMPLMAVSLLMSCGSKPSSEYLELWNKETIYNKDGSINQEETRKYQDKLMVQNVTTKYHYDDSPWKEIDTYEYTYNEYGNVTTIKQTHESIADNKTSWTRIIQYAYQYQDGLMISKDIIIPEGNKYSASHFEYKYDSNRRLISESTTTSDGTPVYDDTYTYQKDFTNFLTYEHKDHPQSAAYDESYRIERVLDDNGYITEETHYDFSNAAQDERYRRACYTYDKYHCLIVEKFYRHLYEGEEEKLIMTITTSYHRHNPNKPEKIETVYHNRSNAQTQTDIYSYDKYHRKVCIDSVYIDEEKIDEQAKTTYEYDELIKA